jgi:hypothetical protein
MKILRWTGPAEGQISGVPSGYREVNGMAVGVESEWEDDEAERLMKEYPRHFVAVSRKKVEPAPAPVTTRETEASPAP